MAKRWNRTETWVGLIVLGIGGIILAVGGLWVYVSATTKPLHPDAGAVPSATVSDPSQQWTASVERARQHVRAAVADQNLPGLSVAVGIADTIAWAEGFGFANIENKEPVGPGTRFRIGTASIPLTAAAAGVLIDKGALDIDAPIQTYVPEFPTKQWPVTLRQLMGHTAGLSNDGGDEGPLFGRQCERPVDAIPYFATGDLRFEPGTEYRYSRFSWIPISAAIEAAANEPFVSFMQKHIFTPLGMDDTLAESSTETIQDRAVSYFPRFAADTRYGPDVMRELNLSCYAGASVFLSTASDLVRFSLAMNGGKLVKPATVQLLQTGQRLPSGQDTGYGLGWDIETVTVGGTPTRAIGHDGDLLGGVAVTLMTLPDHGIVVAALSNTSYADTSAIAVKVADAFAPSAAR